MRPGSKVNQPSMNSTNPVEAFIKVANDILFYETTSANKIKFRKFQEVFTFPVSNEILNDDIILAEMKFNTLVGNCFHIIEKLNSVDQYYVDKLNNLTQILINFKNAKGIFSKETMSDLDKSLEIPSQVFQSSLTSGNYC